jgi:hypothetical protein
VRRRRPLQQTGRRYNPRGKIKNRAKIEKSVDAFPALPLEATFHKLSAVILQLRGEGGFKLHHSSTSLTIHEKEIHFAIRLL